MPASDPADVSAQTEPVGHDAVLQHTRSAPPASTQCPLVHCVSSVHVVPSPPVVWHVPPLHAYPAAQSVAVVVHVVLHEDPPHKNPPQLDDAGAAQVPNPSQ